MVQCDILPYLRATHRHHVVDEPPFLLVSLTVINFMFIIVKMKDILSRPMIYPAVPICICHALHPAAAMAVCRAFAPTQIHNPDRSAPLQARITASSRALLSPLSQLLYPTFNCFSPISCLRPISSDLFEQCTPHIIHSPYPEARHVGPLAFRFTYVAWGCKSP